MSGARSFLGNWFPVGLPKSEDAHPRKGESRDSNEPHLVGGRLDVDAGTRESVVASHAAERLGTRAGVQRFDQERGQNEDDTEGTQNQEYGPPAHTFGSGPDSKVLALRTDWTAPSRVVSESPTGPLLPFTNSLVGAPTPSTFPESTFRTCLGPTPRDPLTGMVSRSGTRGLKASFWCGDLIYCGDSPALGSRKQLQDHKLQP
jgi:hypothetical protein